MSDFIYNFTEYFNSWMIYILSFMLSLILSKIFCNINKRVKQKSGILYMIFLWISYFFIALPVVLTIGLRARGVGFDTYNYYTSYANMKQSFSETFMYSSNKLEVGFILFRWIIFKVTGGAELGAVFPMTLLTVMLMCHAFVVWGKKIDLTFGLFIFYSVFGLNLCDQSRQLLAAALLAVAIHSLYHQKTFKYIIFVLLAASFHSSALMGFFLIFFIGMEKWSLRDKVIYFILATVVIAVLLRTIIIERYSSHIGLLENEGILRIGMAWILDMIPIFVPYFFVKPRDLLARRIRLFSWSAIVFRIAGYFSYFIMRMYYYPAIFSWVMLLGDIDAENSCSRNIRKNNLIIIIVCVVYFCVNYILLLQHNVVPYESILK